MRTVLALIVAVLALAGCASMSESECKTADWYRKGLADGTAGRSDDTLARHHEACAKVGVAPNVAQWRRGWEEGLRSFCVPAVGWREGLAGHGYSGACRGPAEDGFLRAWRTASDLHRTEAQIATNTRETERLEKQLADSQNADERRNLRDRIRGLDVDQAQLRQRAAVLRQYAP
ncbi:MAG TPA: DUF2799 domain-containing protein [Albitalea sp.]|uniref:DUF2799 domain-containing protein n=1 Tax=Piscinibacter sp. TaxID=1903157 RepID=UPI002ED52802